MADLSQLHFTDHAVPLVREGEFRNRIQIIPSHDFGGLSQFTARLDDRNRLLVGADARAVLAQSEDQLFSLAGPAGAPSQKANKSAAACSRNGCPPSLTA